MPDFHPARLKNLFIILFPFIFESVYIFYLKSIFLYVEQTYPESKKLKKYPK